MNKKAPTFKPSELIEAATNEQAPVARQVRLLGVQDEEGYHLCLGFLKEGAKEGEIAFEEVGQKMITYGAYEVAIQDLEACLAHAKALREEKLAEIAKTAKTA